MNKKTVLYYSISIITVILTFWFVFFYPNWKEINKLKLLSSGTYFVDFDSSEEIFTEKEIEYYSDTQLQLNVNGKFVFSKSVPIARGSMGEWKITGNELERGIYLKYKSGLRYHVSTCTKLGCILRIQIPIYDENILIGYKFLAFRKIKE